jgi:hypothetical protein
MSHPTELCKRPGLGPRLDTLLFDLLGGPHHHHRDQGEKGSGQKLDPNGVCD